MIIPPGFPQSRKVRGRALTLAELILLNELRAQERARKEELQMTAKIGGLARFVKDIQSLDADGDEMADALEQLIARKSASKAAFLYSIAGANAAFDTVDALTAAFGNGGPSTAGSAASQAQPASPATPAKAAAPAAETAEAAAPATPPANPQ